MKNIAKPLLFAGICALCGAMSIRYPVRLSGDVPPEKALSTFELAEGFQIELIASEPLVADPVAMEIDEQGRLYVVEMHGYPLDKSGTGKVKVLKDTDGDGKMDRSTVFAEGLMLPTGVLRWKKGILVTDAPNVLYLEDTDGDNRADVRDTLLTGFALSNPQHNLNNPILGLDNWIYLGHEGAVSTQTYQQEFGDRGGVVFYPAYPAGPRLPQNAGGQGVRMKPDRNELEALASRTQFGHTFDSWGRYFVVTNANHAIHQVISAEYLGRNRDLLVSSATESISDHHPAAEVFPITKNPENQLLTDVGVFTSACGPVFYQGGLFPPVFDSVLFVAEPVSNLVHADLVQKKGSTFSASRLYPRKEFLASTDAWFRPVNMYTGPDGALYIIDYYRQFIEHPEWMADEMVRSGALYNGTDKGRIYRISPKGTPPPNWTSGLAAGALSDGDLVQKLADPNIWWRRNAQRLLIDRGAVSQTSALEKMVMQSDSPPGRIHALWTLEGLHRLTPAIVITALGDKVPGIRENALRLAERYMNTHPGVIQKMVSMTTDPDPRVRFQLLCSLGGLDAPEIVGVRKELLFRDMADSWVQVAALTAVSHPEKALLSAILNGPEKSDPAYTDFLRRLSTMVASISPWIELSPLIQRALLTQAGNTERWQAPVLAGLAEGIQKSRRGVGTPAAEDLEKLATASVGHVSAPVRESCIQILGSLGAPGGEAMDAILRQAVDIAGNPSINPDYQVAAIHLLALKNPQDHIELFRKRLLTPGSLSVQQASLQALSAIPDETVCRIAVEQWAALTPELRNQAISAFLTNERRITLLLDALERKIIDPASIGWPRSVRLMNQRTIPLRDRARSLLTAQTPGRQEVIKKYAPALRLTGKWEQGKTVFAGQCAACHQVNGALGTAYGPDLGTIRNRRLESILGDILDPNFSIADGYDLWSIELDTGETLDGLIASETPTTLSVRTYGGSETQVARTRIKSIRAQTQSGMPAGLESQISPQQMADLLAFLKQAR